MKCEHQNVREIHAQANTLGPLSEEECQIIASHWSVAAVCQADGAEQSKTRIARSGNVHFLPSALSVAEISDLLDSPTGR